MADDDRQLGRPLEQRGGVFPVALAILDAGDRPGNAAARRATRSTDSGTEETCGRWYRKMRKRGSSTPSISRAYQVKRPSSLGSFQKNGGSTSDATQPALVACLVSAIVSVSDAHPVPGKTRCAAPMRAARRARRGARRPRTTDLRPSCRTARCPRRPGRKANARGRQSARRRWRRLPTAASRSRTTVLR